MLTTTIIEEAEALSATGEAESTKLVEVEMFRESRKIGIFPKGVVTDLLSVVEMCRRDVVGKGRDISLGPERLASVETALAAGSECPFNSVLQLREAISRWYQEHRDRWDADTHYDARRAQAYAAHNAVPQKVLTDRALELGHMPPGKTDLRHQLVLDLGGGTGLSAKAFQEMGAWAINVDLSSHMLHSSTANDAVRVDMGQPLPFRDGAFDAAVSMSALHYLCADEVGTERGHQDRLRACFSSVRRCVRPGKPVVFQFFPQPNEQDMTFGERALQAARAEGLAGTIVVDQPHHTAGWRWFLCLEHAANAAATTAAGCQQCALYHPSGASCVLSLTEGMAYIHEEHAGWMLTEHAKFARRLIRTRAHILLGQQEQERGAASAAAEGEGIQGTGGEEGEKEGPRRKKRRKGNKRQLGEGMSPWETTLAEKLTAALGAAATLKELKGPKRETLLAVLHGADLAFS